MKCRLQMDGPARIHHEICEWDMSASVSVSSRINERLQTINWVHNVGL